MNDQSKSWNISEPDRDGCDLNDGRDRDHVPAKKVANDIGPSARAEVVDVSDPDSVRELMTES